ncbi:MAG: hypothetical protein UW81_C0021G0003 [Candidatus Giovannonibacteria bacterium GW2011_GWC2_44_9]|uniref:Uncharacterized protein n=3 Tax=Candidatus Giovannoniibacteriota TaxID=1752738 RepID=A0A0G1LW60_9BACT|nr:MAG: hypothetical protein UW49_C0004G0090 [Candidatus Giovannonibacteria bacterium GW2011_GWB1_44_23]KKT63979.1 MAG: hypothetical protein UW57_C0004G0089 [Candidatus Giovannonibacteria bacterium GW2011_GWA1_44_29]KKT83299.1 MAG: hypothetical protein UW81_C0021G0003 [Candidatus Giovannonibacteria bacterium GW2011_GWC2_44_9]KKT91692.1 MAG: hypothetical protein UW93_C0004G0090 [Parcubacteria group bacterium GW2011_GWC1_45_13]
MAKPQKESIWLLKKPIGDSEVIRRGNLMRRTTSAFTCEFCGTYHKELNQADVGRTIFRLLGREGVMECCGKLVDIVYKEWKNNFVEHFLEEEFSAAPLDNKFYVLRGTLLHAIGKWKAKAEKTREEANKVVKLAVGLTS